MVNKILDTVIRGGRQQWSSGSGFIRIDGSNIIFENDEKIDQTPISETSLSFGDEIELPVGRKLVSRIVETTDSLLEDLTKGKYSERTTVLIDSDRLPDNLFIVRQWRPGDRYQALNAPGIRKLQDMFVDRKISRKERNRLPVVLTTDSLIIWCPGLPVSHRFRVTKKTNTILQLTYTF
jgi:tRNA(Ile)-lysidine synthetase-like protein